jgi:hypothetical protein
MTTKKLGDSLRYFSPMAPARGPHEAFSATGMETAKPAPATALASSSRGMNFCVFLSQAPPTGPDAKLMRDYREVCAQLLQIAGVVSAHVRDKAQAQGGVFAGELWAQTLQHVPLWSTATERTETISGVPSPSAFADRVGKAFVGFLAGEALSAENDLPRRLWSAISSQWPKRESSDRSDFTFNLLLLTIRIAQGADARVLPAFGLFSAAQAMDDTSIKTTVTFGPWSYGEATEGTRRQIDAMLRNVPADRVAEGGNYLNYSFND